MSLLKWDPFGSLRWDPFKEIESIHDRLSNLLAQPSWRAGGASKEMMSVAEWAPVVDITEDEKEYLIKAELPGVKKEEVKVSVENGVLSLSGERKYEHEEKSKKQHRVERAYGKFVRSFTLPDEVNPAKVNAEFHDGVLHVHLPKEETVKPKALQITVS
jgi:HSP20 family protein